MKPTSNSVLIKLYTGLIYFPSGFLYLNESDFFFEKLTVIILLIISLIAFANKRFKNETGMLMVAFMTFMLTPLILNIADLTASESRIIDSIGQFIRVCIYFGAALYISFRLPVNLDRQDLARLALTIIRVTVYGQVIILFARVIGFGWLIDQIFISKSILYIDEVADIIKYDGSLGNPNYFGYLMCLILFGLFKLRKTITRKEYLSLSIMTVGMIIISGSRTSFIVLLIEFALFYPIYFAIMLIPLLPLLEIIVQVNSRLLELFEAISTSGSVETFEIRRDLIQQSLAYISHRPFFGYGYRPIEITDNFYVTHIMRYGWFGFLAHAGIIFFLMYRKAGSVRYVILFLVPVVVFNYTGAFIDNFRLFFATSLFFFVCIDKSHFHSHRMVQVSDRAVRLDRPLL